MKRKSIICMLSLGMMVGMFSTSCQDMLSPNSERHSYTVAEDTLYSYWGILKSLQNIAERYVILNECRGDLVDASSFVSDTIAAIVEFGDVEDPDKWKDGACVYLKISDYYHVINSCNAYIAMCDTDRTTGTNAKYMKKEYAQVQAIRAWVYMQLLYAYGENRVPFYTEPMLTTNAIDDFDKAFKQELKNPSKSRKVLNIPRLVEELAPELERVEAADDKNLGMPELNNYGDVNSGNAHFVCHSSKCMFPVSIVLGDLYLLSGDYVKSATHYFNYLKYNKCGPLPTDKYYCDGLLDDKLDYPIYSYTGVPYTERGAVSAGTELVTCIPSNKSKLEGKVLTDINRLFGFEAQLRTDTYVNSEGEGSSAGSVTLTRNYERELIPSKGYEALCDSQKYEIYVGTITDGNVNYESLQELPGVGDARRAWIYGNRGQQWTFRVGDDNLYGKMVSKQNPGGSFSSTYPVIYRKSTVWLRYAEALNRAGFPSYAFAILKSGLCNHSNWFPTDPDREDIEDGKFVPATSLIFDYFLGGTVIKDPLDYPINDSLFFYVDTWYEEDGNLHGRILPDDYVLGAGEQLKKEAKIRTYADLEALVNDSLQKEYDDYQAGIGPWKSNEPPKADEPVKPMTGPRTIKKANVCYQIPSESAIGNQPNSSCRKTCNYLDLREVRNAEGLPYMDFSYLTGLSHNQLIFFKEQGKLFTNSVRAIYYPYGNDPLDWIWFATGVHQRGCGFIRYNDDPEKFHSSYNYVDQVCKKVKENTGKDLTADDIYNSSRYTKEVMEAVEDLIIDEMGLELAFEGTRFSDLFRVANRRGDNDYLAKRVAKRHTGEIDEDLRSRLRSNRDSWFLPIPEE